MGGCGGDGTGREGSAATPRTAPLSEATGSAVACCRAGARKGEGQGVQRKPPRGFPTVGIKRRTSGRNPLPASGRQPRGGVWGFLQMGKHVLFFPDHLFQVSSSQVGPRRGSFKKWVRGREFGGHCAGPTWDVGLGSRPTACSLKPFLVLGREGGGAGQSGPGLQWVRTLNENGGGLLSILPHQLQLGPPAGNQASPVECLLGRCCRPGFLPGTSCLELGLPKAFPCGFQPATHNP